MVNGVKRIRAGSRDSAERLEQLAFDPLEEAVNLYRRIQRELTYQDDLREGLLDTRVPYRADSHMALYGHARSAVSDLLRYKYGRVSELPMLAQTATPQLTIMLAGVDDAQDSPPYRSVARVSRPLS